MAVFRFAVICCHPRSSAFYFCVLLLLVIVADAPAQSGRGKATPTPSPRTIVGPSILNHPGPTPKTTPTPEQKKDDDVITVQSTLVPTSVSVLDANSRAVTNLKLADFELKIDGKVVNIDDMSRSE